jgi:UDP-N-acetyl-D-mannosaminuronic acid dehydrogenase
LNKKTVCVVGLGYIGLPTAALLASNGYQVVGVDLNTHTVKTINQGRIHFDEPDLDAFVRSAVSAGRLEAFTTPQAGDVYMICVPTPFHEGEGIPQPNIDYVLAATRSIAGFVKPGDLVILESTSPVGTTQQMADVLKTAGVNISLIHMAYCPERVLPGKIMTELVENDRVIGGMTPKCSEAAARLYKIFVEGECVITKVRTAEMCKLTENSFRDVNIAFANELSIVADRMGLDVWEVIRLANRHPRVNILQPGPGVGGHCIAVDPWFIVASAPDDTPLIRTARGVNDQKMHHVIAQATELIEGHPGARIACLGLAFKANIDDFRESPARFVAARIARKYGNRVSIVEPYAHALPVEFTDTGARQIDLDDALESCDLLIVLVDHDVFKVVPLAERSGKVVYDTRGIWPDQPDADTAGTALRLAS